MGMVKEFIEEWDARKGEVRAKFAESRPSGYVDIVRAVVSILGDYYGDPDPQRIHEINDGDYQGTLVYVIGERGYQPDRYWYVRVYYGSCSGCDTLEAICGYGDEVSESELDGYMTLALHIIQGLREMGGECV